MLTLTAISSFVVLSAILVLKRCMDNTFYAVDTQFTLEHMHWARVTDLLLLSSSQTCRTWEHHGLRWDLCSVKIISFMGKYSCDARQIKWLKIKYVVKECKKNKFYELCMIKSIIGTSVRNINFHITTNQNINSIDG